MVSGRGRRIICAGLFHNATLTRAEVYLQHSYTVGFLFPVFRLAMHYTSLMHSRVVFIALELHLRGIPYGD